MKTIEQKAFAYDKAIEALRSLIAEQAIKHCDRVNIKDITNIFSELKESEDERIREDIISHFAKGIEGSSFNEVIEKYKIWIAWLEKQGEQKPAEHLELKAGHWYICHRAYCCRADHLTVKEGERFMCEKDGIVKGFMIKEPEKYFKEVCPPAPMKDEHKPADLPNGEDYGIDSLYHAARILEKTLGEVDGYQSDDGILEHKCAIEAVNRLYKQKPAAWSEEDIMRIDNLIAIIENRGYPDYVEYLEKLKERYTWKPSEEQIEALLKLEEMHVLEHGKNQENAHLYMMVKSIREQLLKLREK